MRKIRMQSEKAIGCLYVLLLLITGTAVAHDATKVFSKPPGVAHVDVEKDMLIIVANSGIYAQCMETGQRLWFRSLPDGSGFGALKFGVDDVIIEEQHGILVLDKTTGKDRWRHEDTKLTGPARAEFLGNSKWIAAKFNEETIVYTPEGRPLQPSFQGETFNYDVAGCMPDGITLLLTQSGKRDLLNTLTTYFWQPERDLLEKGYVLSTKEIPLLYYVSPSGKAIYNEFTSNPYRFKLSLIDGRTGVVERILETPLPGYLSGYHFTNDGYMLTMSVEGDSVTAVNLETESAAVAIAREGHRFNIFRPVIAHGQGWIYSWDTERRYWLWPLEEGATPQMIWETPPGRHARGTIQAIRPPHILFDRRWNKMEAFSLESMERVKTWRAGGPPSRRFMAYVCADLNRALAYYTKEDEARQTDVSVTQVFEADLPEPIRDILGDPKGISPDGRYCAVQRYESWTVHLVDIDSGAECAVITPETEAGANVLFSPDSRFMAVDFNSETTTVLTLDNDFSQRRVERSLRGAMAFSPDGTYFAAGGTGGASIFASETGKEVHTFIEPEKVASRDGPKEQGFLDTALQYGKHFVGFFVKDDPWGSYAWVTIGFAEGGKQLITLAEGQILRVWDIPSGKLLRTIRTGLAEKRNAYGRINNHLVLSGTGAYAFAYNSDGFDPAELWEISTGKLLRHYTLPAGKIREVVVTDDGAAIYLKINDELYSLAGVGQ